MAAKERRRAEKRSFWTFWTGLIGVLVAFWNGLPRVLKAVTGLIAALTAFLPVAVPLIQKGCQSAPTPTPTPWPSGRFTIQSKATDLCLTAARDPNKPNSPPTIVQVECANSPNQVWMVVLPPDKDYCEVLLKGALDKDEKQCLQVERAEPDDFPSIGLLQSPSGLEQRWKLIQVEPGYYMIESPFNDRVIDVPWGKKVSGGQIILFGQNRGNGQLWRFVPF